MRFSCSLSLLVFCLAVVGNLGQSTARAAGDKPLSARAGQKKPVPVKIIRSWTVSAMGETAEDAEQAALEKAQDEVILYLRQQNPPVEWTPSLDYIRARLVKERNEEPIDKPIELAGMVHKVRLNLEMDNQTASEILNQDRQLHVTQRMTMLAKVLGGILAVLIVLASYLRLEEWSKGYYTRWLRVAAIGCLGAAGAALWLLLAEPR